LDTCNGVNFGKLGTYVFIAQEIGEKMAKIIVLNYSGFIGSIHQRSDQSSL
jgi:hypothetical protein